VDRPDPGAVEDVRGSNLATVFITGNDMTVSPDMAFRCLICDLFVQEANVQERKVAKPITDSWLMDC
jgi:hypothetical protein